MTDGWAIRSNSITMLLCRIDQHDYEPQYTVSMDAIGIGDDPYPLRMRWKCTRCGEKITLPAGVSPDKRELFGGEQTS
jgi:hypothetical protein